MYGGLDCAGIICIKLCEWSLIINGKVKFKVQRRGGLQMGGSKHLVPFFQCVCTEVVCINGTVAACVWMKMFSPRLYSGYCLFLYSGMVCYVNSVRFE